MKQKILTFLFSTLCLVCVSLKANAADHPEAHFGEFGIQHLPTLQAYQNAYLGKTVMYLPTSPKPSFDDTDKFEKDWKGKFNTEYTISKISGNDKKIKLELVEVGNPKSKIKFTFNNQYEYYSYGDYTYCVTDKFTIPLVVVDALNEANQNDPNIGRKFTASGVDNALEITGIVMDATYSPKVGLMERDGYPEPCYQIKNNITNSNFVWPISDSAAFSSIGKVLTHPKVRASYEVIGLTKDTESKYSKKLTTCYLVKNSETGAIKQVRNLTSDPFSDDISGKYIATLSKVEKPSNPAVRYGKTTEITDDKGITKFSYVDDYIDLIILALPEQFSFVLKNVSENTLKVVWNEAVFVDSDGSTSKIMHVGTKYSQREGDQPATTIIKGAKIDDVATPTKNVRYSDVLKEWVTDSMFPKKPAQDVEPIRLMLPIAVKDVTNEYIFEFDVKYVYNHPDRLVDQTE